MYVSTCKEWSEVFLILSQIEQKTTGNLGGTAGDDSPVPMEAVTLPLGQGFFYSREQRAKRTCWHVHLATAARVKDPDACTGVFDYLRCDK